MSKIAIKTAWIVAFIVGLVAMYGHGYHKGKHAQLSMNQVLEIVKAQYTCKMEFK